MRLWRKVMGVLVTGFIVGAFGITAAQQNARVAFVNSSGQLIVSSVDGYMRWIVTNPGEVLVDPVGYTWSPDGTRLFFAVNLGGEVSLRVGEANTQTVRELTRTTASTLSGGEWSPDGSGVLVGLGDRAVFVSAADGSFFELTPASGEVTVRAPFADDQPQQFSAQALSPDTRFLFYQGTGGQYAVQSLGGASAFSLSGVNDANARGSGLWADSAPLVAYWGYAGNSTLSVTDASNGATITLDSGRSTPITPLAWRPATTQLLFRDGTGFVRAADVGCVSTGCDPNPLQTGTEVLPPTATDVLVDENWLYFRDSSSLFALPIACIDTATCSSSALVLDAATAPNTLMDIANGVLAYTGYSAYSNDTNDRDVRVIVLDCLNSGVCAPQSVLSGANAGLLAPDGRALVVEQIGAGISILDLTNGATIALTDSLGGAGLSSARWSP